MLLLGFSFTPSETNEKNKVILSTVIEALNAVHYQPKAINDKFSEDLFHLFFKRMDYAKRYFLQSDIDNLSKYKTKIDDEILKSEFGFYNDANDVFAKRVDLIEKSLPEIFEKPMDLNVEESIESDVEKVKYCKDEKELIDRWRKSIKYQIVSRVVERLEFQEKATDSVKAETKMKTVAELEIDARKKVKESHDELFKNFRKRKEKDKLAFFINAITSIYDPHSNYFPAEDKENFDISMSGKLEGIGARLQETGGFIKVTEIVPGSPCWKQGDLKANDVILKVAQSTEEAIDVVDMPIDEAIKLIRGKKDTEVRLTVKQGDGTIKVIPIIRDVVELEETYAKSYILKNEKDNKKYGMIFLPKFYADFANPTGRRCATDIKIELEKLKKENVDGIIFDLRNNGGGSLSDVVDISGLFIETGPIVQVKGPNNSIYPYVDRDKSITYNGPLVVLVNNFSASASEIFAAAMQDYKRAVILGSSSTFGKGTVQRFVPLDDAVAMKNPAFRPAGELKLTTQKFYRINGGTTQLKGVIPDVIIPDNYKYSETGEKEQEFVMPYDVISESPFKVWSSTFSKNYVSAISSSNKRIANDEFFQKVDLNAKRLKGKKENSKIPLSLASYRKFLEKDRAEEKKYTDLNKEVTGLEVSNLKVDLESILKDDVQKKKNDDFIKNLKKDHYLLESMFVLKDVLAK